MYVSISRPESPVGAWKILNMPPVIRLEILICPSAQWIEAVVYGKVSDFMIP